MRQYDEEERDSVKERKKTTGGSEATRPFEAVAHYGHHSRVGFEESVCAVSAPRRVPEGADDTRREDRVQVVRG
jgi:hypothetical protein